MYPTISFALESLFGINLPLPIQTFGFFMALAFVTGTLISYKEFKRLEGDKILYAIPEKVIIGAPASIWEIILNAFLGFLLGFKGLAMAMNWRTFSDDPQSFILSNEGNVLGGIVLALVFGLLKHYEKQKTRLDKPIEKEVMVYPHERLGDMVIIAAIVGILGSKVFTWIEDWQGFLQDPIGAITAFSGMTYYGGLISAAIVLLIYGKKKHIPVPRLADVAAPALIMGYGVGRLGCHFSGDGDWGIANTAAKPFSFLPDWLWSYTYPNNVINAGEKMADCVGKFCYELPVGVYPTSAYEFLLAGSIFLILWSLRKHLKVPGLIFALYLVLNGIERFMIETIRVNDRYDYLLNFSQAQTIAVGLMLTGVLVGIIAYQANKTATS